MLKIYYDYQAMLGQKFGGVSRYCYELAVRIAKYGAEPVISCIHNHNYYFRDMLGFHDVDKIPQRLKNLEWKFFSCVNILKGLYDLRKPYDIIHPTYFNNYMLGHYKGKLIITVHDMMGELGYLGDVNSKYVKRHVTQKRNMINAADRIIVISECTKNALLKIYPDTAPEKISLVYQGGAFDSDRLVSGVDPMPEIKYILHVGRRGQYKNTDRFFEAMKIILSRHKNIHLLLAGTNDLSEYDLKILGGYSDRIHTKYLTDDELTGAYQNALCFVFPSLYEGFGAPVIEAMSCGCPVVLSRASVFPEIAGDAGEYFNPLEIDDIAEKIDRVISNENLRAQMRSFGFERAKIFTWDNTAENTFNVYKKALENF